MIDIANALATGVTVAGALKGLDSLVNLVHRRNGKNGNGSAFSQEDHDALKLMNWGVDRLHDDLTDLKQIMRDCLDGKRY